MPASGSAPSTGTSPLARTCSRRSTWRRSRRCAAPPRTSWTEPPWDALVAWLHRFLDYVATKQALSQELFNHLGRDADVFRGCRTAFYAAGDRLLVRAQDSGDVRTDVSIDDVVMLVAGISKMPATTEGQVPRILDIALEGLRRTAQPGGTAR